MKPFELLNRKELAALLGRSPGYVSAMKRAGFQQAVPGRYRYAQALDWLQQNPGFKTTDAYTCKRWRSPHLATPRNT